MPDDFLDFLHTEQAAIESGDQTPPLAVPSAARVESSPMPITLDVGAAPKKRHSLKSCACEKCQEKRRALAVQFGLMPDEMLLEAEDETPDEEFVGKFLTLYHTYRFTTLSVKSKDIAEAWRVSTDTQETLGKLGHKVLAKWLRKAEFPYKTETILVLYLGGDIGIRFLEEAKIKALLQKIEALEALPTGQAGKQ